MRTALTAPSRETVITGEWPVGGFRRQVLPITTANPSVQPTCPAQPSQGLCPLGITGLIPTALPSWTSVPLESVLLEPR